jgi:hypothetical protein
VRYTAPHALYTALTLTQLVWVQGCFFEDNTLGSSAQPDATQDMSAQTLIDMSSSDMTAQPDLPSDRPDLEAAEDLGLAADMPTTSSCMSYTLQDGSTCLPGECAMAQSDCDAISAQRCAPLAPVTDEDSCTITCEPQPVSMCLNDDGCCPAGCTLDVDNDCRTPLLNDLCGQPVYEEELQGRAVVIDKLVLDPLCCDDLDSDGSTDNGWVNYLFNGASSYNTRLADAFDEGLVHMLLEFEGTGQTDDLSSATSIVQHIGEPQCFTDITQSDLRVYKEDADVSPLAFDSFSVGKSLPPRLSALTPRMMFPMFGDQQDIFHVPVRNVRVQATIREDADGDSDLTGGTLSGHITPYDYFSAINEYYDEVCPCFEDSMFELDTIKKSYTCNDLSAHTCVDQCSASTDICNFLVDRFSSNADIDPLKPDQVCVPNSGNQRGTCTAISIGLQFETRSAYLQE